MTPRLQRVLDAFTIPAIIRTARLGRHRLDAPAARVLTDYSQLPLAERNVLRRLYRRRALHSGGLAEGGQLIVNAFRADVTRMAPRKKLTS